MELNRGAPVDTSQVEDQRGSGGGGGLGGLPIPTGRGGIVGLIVTVVVLLLGGGYAGTQILGGGGSPDNSTVNAECSSANPNALDHEDCRNILYVNSIQAFWTTELPRAYGIAYEKAPTDFFTGQTQTGCGAADSGAGPFYCPPDRKVYIDLSFYDELSTRFGAHGQFAQPYVLAHEYGHHVQDLDGTMSKVDSAEQRDPNAANKYSVMLELQADCFAGVWAHHALETKAANGKPIFTSITPQDIQDAVNAAGAVGDDAIQKQAGQQVNPDSFTHGSSAQREHWFTAGYRSGAPSACDTFGSAI